MTDDHAHGRALNARNRDLTAEIYGLILRVTASPPPPDADAVQARLIDLYRDKAEVARALADLHPASPSLAVHVAFCEARVAYWHAPSDETERALHAAAAALDALIPARSLAEADAIAAEGGAP